MNLTVKTPNFISFHLLLTFSSVLQMNSYVAVSFRWLQNLYSLPNYFSFVNFYTVFSRRSSQYLNSTFLTGSTRKSSRRLKLPFTYTQSHRLILPRHIKTKDPKRNVPKTVRHLSVEWEVNFLSSIKSHKLLGTIPFNTFRGDSTRIHTNSTIKLLNRKNYRKSLTPTLAILPKVTTRLALLRLYLHTQSSVTTSVRLRLPSLTNQFNSLVWLWNRRLWISKLPRFRPYRYLDIEWPERSSEAAPSLHFRTFQKKLASHSYSSTFTLPSPSTLKSDSYSPPKLQNFFSVFHRKLPHKLRSSLRWKRYSKALNFYPHPLKTYFSTHVPTELPFDRLTRFLSYTVRNEVNRKTTCSSPILTTVLKSWIQVSPNLKPKLELSNKKFRHVRKQLFSTHRNRTILIIRLRQISRRLVRSSNVNFPLTVVKTVSRTARFREDFFFTLWVRNFNFHDAYLRIRPKSISKKPISQLSKFAILPTQILLAKNSARPLIPTRIFTKQIKSSTLYDLEDIFFPNNPWRKVKQILGTWTSPIATSKLTHPLDNLTVSFSKFQLDGLNPYPKLSLPALDIQTLNEIDCLQVKPLDSFKFRRSDFFFLNLAIRPLPLQLDLISSNPFSGTNFDYHIFPEANIIKVAVFRRLNKQKTLFRNRHLAFNVLSNKTAWGINMGTSKFCQNSNHIPFYDTQKSSLLTLRRVLSPYPNLRHLSRPNHKQVRIPRVRFKPGYGRIWREARRSIRELANVPVRYQYRLTPKLHWLYLQDRKLLKPYSYASLDYVILSSHLVPDFWSLREILNNKTLFLNGLIISNPNLKLFINDFIQIVVNLRFYITLKWLRVWSETRQNRVSRIFYSKYRPSATNRNQKFVRRLPSWFFDLKFVYRSIPQIIEVDFFTLSVFVIHDKQVWDLTEPLRGNLYDMSSLNMYNWKYIT